MKALQNDEDQSSPSGDGGYEATGQYQDDQDKCEQL